MTEEIKNQRKKLVVLDGNHLIHRAFHAIQAPLKTSSGEPTNAIYGFASMLFNIIELEKPDYLVATFDERAPTFRHKAHAEYKATRAKAPDALYAQIPRIREMMERFKIPAFSKEGFEADDVMATLAKQAEALGIVTYVVTGDMDVLQMVNPSIFVVFPHKGYREPVLYNAERVFQKYGVRPDQIVDYKALMGDSSDNFKGVQGIGPKGASGLLARHQTLEGIYAHLDEVPVLLRQKLEAGHKDAFFSRSLAKIVTDVPCVFDPSLATFHHLDFQEGGRFLESLEIRNLQGRLRKIMPAEALHGKEQLSLF